MTCLRNISFCLLGLVTLSIITATIVERIYGTAVAMDCIYHSPWMIALWTLLAVAGIGYVVLRRSSMSVAAIGLHISMALILVGAGITFVCGREGRLELTEGAVTDIYTASDGKTEKLPFSIELAYAEILYHPGTSSPMDFVSHLIITNRDGDRGSRRCKVSMNNVLSTGGYRFYQTGIGVGRSTLSISHDPVGIGVSYAGYALLALCMVAFFFTRQSRFRAVLRRYTTLVLVLVCAFEADATDTTGTDAPRTLQRPLAENFGRLYAYWNGRVVPLQTVARELCLKLHGSVGYGGLTSEQILTGWLFYYDDWKKIPYIKVKDAEVRRLLGVEGKYASLTDFYKGGKYLLDGRSDRAALEADEKVGLLSSLCAGTLLKIFPARTADGATDWYSWVERMPGEEAFETSVFASENMLNLSQCIARGRFNDADCVLTEIKAYQRAVAGADNLPGSVRFSCEIAYNRIFNPWLPAALALLVGIVAMVMSVHRRFIYIVGGVLVVYQSTLLVLRWIIGGHIPMTNGYETMQTMAWIALSLTLFSCGKFRALAPSGLIVAGLAMLVGAMGESNPPVSPLMPVLSSPLLSVHVFLVMTAYALFAVMMLNSVLALFRPIEAARRADLSTILAYPAVFALACGIFIGGVWANQSWGRYWGWDPKETWALVTLIVYAVPLHVRSFPGLGQPRRMNVYYLLAFISVLFTYFGVNYFLSGLHSYAA